MFTSITKIRVTTITALIIASLLLMGCGTDHTGERVWVYETNQYQVYRQVASLIANSEGETAALVMEGIDGQSGVWIFESADNSVKAQTGENFMTEYTILVDKKEVHSFQMPSVDYMIGVKMMYVDITKDRSRDVVIIGEPPRGTRTGSYWLYAYDKKNDCNIEVFENGNSLTDVQASQLNDFYNEEFYELFPDFAYTECVRQFVDEFGNLYYDIAIWDENDICLGDMMIFLTYNKEEKRFDVTDMIYMPWYVWEPK